MRACACATAWTIGAVIRIFKGCQCVIGCVGLRKWYDILVLIEVIVMQIIGARSLTVFLIFIFIIQKQLYGTRAMRAYALVHTFVRVRHGFGRSIDE